VEASRGRGHRWHRWHHRLRRLGVGPWGGALGAAPILLDGYQLSIEHYLLSEALFQALVVGGLALLLWGPRPALAATAVAGILLGLSTVTRFVGGVVIVAALVYCVVARVGWARIGTLVAAFLVPLAAYSAWYESALGTYGITNRNGFFLYGRVSSFADCSKIDPPPNLRRFCLDKPPAERERNFGIFALSSVDLGELVRSKDANARLFDFSRAAIVALGQIMLGFYITCLIFVVVVLGVILRFGAGVSIFVWAMVGIAIWHFAVVVPDRFLGGIMGAFLAAIIIAEIKALCIGIGFVDFGPFSVNFSKLTLVAEFIVMATVLVVRPQPGQAVTWGAKPHSGWSGRAYTSGSSSWSVPSRW
jgi:hypothetical protein